MEVSETARVLVRPFRTYRALRAEADDVTTRRRIVAGASRLLLGLGTLVAITSSGRFAPLEVFTAVPSFAYALLVQGFAVAVVVRLFTKTTRPAFAFGLYLQGHGPWLLAWLAVCAACLFASDTAVGLRRLAPVLGVAFPWGGLLTYACFREGLALSRGRAWAALGVFYTLVTAVVLAYFTLAGQLLPIVPR